MSVEGENCSSLRTGSSEPVVGLAAARWTTRKAASIQSFSACWELGAGLEASGLDRSGILCSRSRRSGSSNGTGPGLSSLCPSALVRDEFCSGLRDWLDRRRGSLAVPGRVSWHSSPGSPFSGLDYITSRTWSFHLAQWDRAGAGLRDFGVFKEPTTDSLVFCSIASSENVHRELVLGCSQLPR